MRNRNLWTRSVLLALTCTTFLGTAYGEELPVAATPEACGVRSAELAKMTKWVRENEYDIRSMVLLRQGKVVLEWNAGGVTREHNHNVFSVTKSVVATLAGIALTDGRIESSSVDLRELFPKTEAVQNDRRKGRVSLENLLTMRSGFQQARANQPGPQRERFYQIHRADDRAQYILNMKMQRDAGETFAYGNAEPQIVSAIIRRTYGERVPQMADRQLFEPLGFANIRWDFPDKTGSVPGGYGLRMRAIDMAKLGQLYLQRGTWSGSRILSPAWVVAATTDQTNTGYGYYWWTSSRDDASVFFAARGVRGQQIYVVPGRGLVFVVVSDLPPQNVRTVRETLNRFVHKAVADDAVLPAQPSDVELLKRELELAIEYTPKHREGLPLARLPQLPE